MKVIVREDAVGEVRRLRAQLERVQGLRMDAAVLPTHPSLAALLPGGGLRAGAAYSVSPSSSLLLSLMARPSREGSWCAAIGMPELGAEAAASLGVALERLVLVPDPGPRWLSVAATLAEVMPVVAVRPGGRVSDAEASRFMARLRDRGATLLVQGVWPQAEASLQIGEPEWSGLGDGHGYLTSRAVTVSVLSRRSPVPRRARMLLPDREGALAPMAAPLGAPMAVPLPMRAVG
ncbi:hypothetical protein LQ938_11115 [Microbacterium sp. cx-55]|uniref:hypothetical protein n=1 Tax=unclassified Microbacterium TaxID=2609290 RepID=UPI001CBE9142|nr:MULTISPECIES: hypothetical protein [unclassified Microbacterium]MCC4908823.1 hypothetical protein [Microbacterium sp. cx-59]UGB34420.1 hypothetical protein LQ938_11115 [Microbacterium sp. cx-55]